MAEPVKSPDALRDLDGVIAAHARLVHDVDGLSDAQAVSPSLLPGWSVGHVLTHIARNADSHVRMLGGADRGQVLAQYEHGREGRAADIEAGAGRSADELVADVVASTERLERAWATLGDLGWSGTGLTVGGPVAVVDLPFLRWREVEVHHVDLGLDYTFADCAPEYVRLETARLVAVWSSRRPMGLTDLPTEVRTSDDATRLAWLLGRREIDGVGPAGVFP